jgi:low affinity Fe/Cu permease
MDTNKDTSRFLRFSRGTSHATGTPYAFVIALLVVVVWAVVGPVFGFSDTWQLVINTGTTIVTFLMVFLIQNTQNRDAEAVQLKLDELIRAAKGADNALMEVEELRDDELAALRERYAGLAERAGHELSQRGRRTEAA